MVRSCICSKKRFCAPCAFAKLLAGAQYGQLLWDFRPSYVLSRVRQVLVILRIAEGAQFTFKSIRAGRATEMAQEGHNIAEQLTTGEWRSKAFLRYCDVDSTPKTLLIATLDHSEDEGERPVIPAANNSAVVAT